MLKCNDVSPIFCITKNIIKSFHWLIAFSPPFLRRFVGRIKIYGQIRIFVQNKKYVCMTRAATVCQPIFWDIMHGKWFYLLLEKPLYYFKVFWSLNRLFTRLTCIQICIFFSWSGLPCISPVISEGPLPSTIILLLKSILNLFISS